MSGPVICSKFDASGSFLATALVALDAHQVKVQSTTNQSSSSSLNTSFTLEKSNKLTNLTWIPSGNNNVELLALCLTRGTVLIYSPQTNEIISELNASANVSILDFHYSEITQSGWSCDIDGNINEWDMNTFEMNNSLKIKDIVDSIDSINRISTVFYQRQPCLLIGSNSIYLFNIKTKEVVKTFPGHIQPINTITPINDNSFMTSAKGDRFINLYQLDKITTKAVFVASSSVESLSIGIQDDKSVLVVINEEGNLEIFNNPLSEQPKSSQPSTPMSKKKRKQIGVSSRSSNGSIKLFRPEKEIKNPHDANLYINAISTLGDAILFTWLENSTVPFFDSLKWIDETGNQFLLDSTKIITKSKPDLRVTQHTTINGHDVAAPKLYSEGHTIISDGSNIRHIDEEDEDQEESLAEKLDRLSVDTSKTPVKSRRKKLEEARSGVSLSIILTQSLQNNDTSLLETVLQNRDTVTIQNTINRLDPYTAVLFLDKLSDKLQRQPTRFETFAFWLKWILVIHGPVIASLPNLNVKLATLYSVLNKKAESLPRLLELQGRLNLTNDNTTLKNEIYDQELVEEDEEVYEPSDVEYIEELDDAQYIGVISEDEDEIMDGVDDYEESEDDEDVEDEDEDDDDDEDVDIPLAADLQSDDEEEE